MSPSGAQLRAPGRAARAGAGSTRISTACPSAESGWRLGEDGDEPVERDVGRAHRLAVLGDGAHAAPPGRLEERASRARAERTDREDGATPIAPTCAVNAPTSRRRRVSGAPRSRSLRGLPPALAGGEVVPLLRAGLVGQEVVRPRDEPDAEREEGHADQHALELRIASQGVDDGQADPRQRARREPSVATRTNRRVVAAPAGRRAGSDPADADDQQPEPRMIATAPSASGPRCASR